MPDYDFSPGSIEQFKGRFARGGADICPLDYALDEANLEFFELGVRTRTGFDAQFNAAVGAWNGKAIRVYEYKKRNEASRLLILDDAGNIYDSSTTMASPILSIPAMSDFSAETMFDRVYISPHDGDRGLSNEKVYVYDGTGSARVAAGAGPSGYTLVGADGAAGNIETGLHLFSVAFETTSGHITRFGLNGAEVLQYTAPGGKKVVLTGIPTGPSNVVARWIIATQVIKDYDGNPNDKSWFIVSDGRIGDNTTTTITLSFFDSGLVDSADRLLNQLTEIPAGSCITALGGRLCVGGERENDATVRVSDAGYPESFSGLDGFVNYNPGDAGGPLRMLFVYREFLFGLKDYRTLTTQDNGAEPSTWKVTSVDDGQGSSVHGASGVLDAKGQSLDSVVICTRSGVSRFTGTYGEGQELTYMIEDLWKRINPVYFHKIQIAVDPVRKHFYVVVPLDSATSGSHIFYCDFSEGMSFDKVKWSVWNFPTKAPSTCLVEVDWNTKQTLFKFGASNIGIFTKGVGTSDFGNAYPNFYRSGFVTPDKTGGVSQFQSIRTRVRGSGALYLKLYGIDDALTVSLPALVLSTGPGREYTREPGFFNSERASLEFGMTNLNEWFVMTKIRLAGNELWGQAWQS